MHKEMYEHQHIRLGKMKKWSI